MIRTGKKSMKHQLHGILCILKIFQSTKVPEGHKHGTIVAVKKKFVRQLVKKFEEMKLKFTILLIINSSFLIAQILFVILVLHYPM
jgi:hypothetical protein